VVAVRIAGLTKTFRPRRSLGELVRPWRKRRTIEALKGVDLEVRAGELVTLLGPNGAGKTTLMKVVATLVVPTAGTVEVLGLDARRAAREVRARVGYVLADERSFFWRLSCRDNLVFFAALDGLHGRAARRRVEEVTALVGLGEHLGRDFADLSTGQRQRMAIARGLLSDPPVLLFDEATRSLDPGRAARLRRIIRELLVQRGNKAVLFATHDLEEARALADRVVLMADGKIAAQGSYAEVEPAIREAFAAEADAEDAEYRRLFGDPA
jgi:ABC-2 type transport system ATP-binding protein